jgi:beta-carotene 15,15'-dioxygenase
MSRTTTILGTHFGVPWLVTALLLVFHGFLPQGSGGNEGRWFFLFSGFFLGMPHGAADLLLAKRWWGIRRRYLLFLVGYLGVVGSYGIAWKVMPEVSWILFLLLTAFHWGGGDFVSAPCLRMGWWERVLSRGGVIIGGALFFSPEAVVTLTETVSGVRWMEYEVQLWGGGVLAVGFLGQVIGWGNASDDEAGWQLVDLGAIILLLAILPVYWAVGAYFIFFHSWRHLARVVNPNQERIPLLIWWKRILVWQMVLLPLSVLLCGVGWMMGRGMDPEELIGRYLILLAVLTLPHLFVVLRWDVLRAQSRGAGLT